MICALCPDRVYAATAHPCCVIWRRLEPGKPCVACVESKRLNAEHRRRQARKRMEKAA